MQVLLCALQVSGAISGDIDGNIYIETLRKPITATVAYYHKLPSPPEGVGRCTYPLGSSLEKNACLGDDAKLSQPPQYCKEKLWVPGGRALHHLSFA